MASAAEVAAMRRAIALSAAGLGTTSPNPPVGCVILGSGDILVGEGYHERKGESHAEAQALAAAGSLAAGATAVVTLEPCNHHGRTPPCRQGLIDAGVHRVVIALIDPTSRGNGGAAELRRAGVDVETGLLADEARVVLGGWLDALDTHRPVITWPYVISSRGFTALAVDSAEERRLRLNADAVLDADGAVREAVPGSHGKGIFPLHDLGTGTSAAVAAAEMYDSGVRRLLLHGGVDTAGPFLEAALVDCVLAYLPSGAPSSRPVAAGLPWPLLPPGFVITAADRIESFVRVEGRRKR
jgi:diaminohydroxyphosphoribosylaminopyrimidine deaminase / 5-amino-6-(5-phosphoribosylamino)uracil reductase